MNIYQSNNLQELKNFDKYPAQLGIIERDIPSGAKEFFKKLMKSHFKYLGEVNKDYALNDIENIIILGVFMSPLVFILMFMKED